MVKKVYSVTISEKILAEWKKYVEDECVNSSKLIEKLISKHLENKRGKK